MGLRDSTTVLDAPEVRDAPVAAVGSTLGRYVVLEEVGRGGMGRVWRAYDPKLAREVALKELRGAELGSEGARRLVAEARALAKVSHPNVVGVFDVEVIGDHELFLVMEFVAGGTLQTWLERPRPWFEVVAKFIDAGRGLVAAHEAGLLHRDFKPANVLLGREDGVVKVSDFGLAKVVGSASSDGGRSHDGSPSDDGLTEAGTIVGTPRYMAPEQHRGAPLTPAVDQYALCVALWEALAGGPPFFGNALAEQKSKGPPVWEGEGLPAAIVEALRRGLAPEPDQRFADMAGLLAALAYDPNRRRRQWTAGALGVAILGVGAASGGVWSSAGQGPCTGAEQQLATIWDDAERQAVATAFASVDGPAAGLAARRSVEEVDAYARDWIAMHTEACEATTMRGEQSPAVMDLRMACLHRAKVELDAVVDVLHGADIDVVYRANEVIGKLRPLARCADVEALQADVEPPPAADAPAVEAAREHLARARAEFGAGRYEAAREHVHAGREAVASADYIPVHSEIDVEEGMVLDALGEVDEAVRVFESALESAGRSQQWPILVSAATRLVYVVGYRQQKPTEGLRYAAMARGLVRTPAQEGALHGALAAVLATQGEYEAGVAEARKAVERWEAAVGPHHPSVATAHTALGNVLGDVGQHDEAVAELRRALEIHEASVGPDHPDVAVAHDNLGTALYYRGDVDEAVAEHRKALAIAEGALGPDHLSVVMTLNNLGNVLQSTDARQEACVVLQRALAGFEATLGPEHPYVAQAQTNLARALLDVDRPADALALAEQAWTHRQSEDIPPSMRGDTAFTLARARWETTTEPATRLAARALAERAAADYRALGEDFAELTAAMDTWLAEHPAPTGRE